MAAAAAYARRGLGKVWPNPAVGAIIVRDDGDGPRVVGRGNTQPPGGPHAEVVALRQAADLARGATCYVTLEPCSHQGRTGPCAVALAEAGVKRVVIGLLDPNPRVAGRGVSMLEAGGVEVCVASGEAARLAAELHAGHHRGHRCVANASAAVTRLPLPSAGSCRDRGVNGWATLNAYRW